MKMIRDRSTAAGGNDHRRRFHKRIDMAKLEVAVHHALSVTGTEQEATVHIRRGSLCVCVRGHTSGYVSARPPMQAYVTYCERPERMPFHLCICVYSST